MSTPSPHSEPPHAFADENAATFVRLIEHFPDMVHSVADDGTIVYANRMAEDLLGYPRTQLVGMHVRDIYADEVLPALDAGFADLKARGEANVESVLKAADGNRIPVEIRSFSIYGDDGQFERTFSILRDMRPIRELRNSLVHAGRLAAIGEMSSGVAHDINNPLTVIMISLEMLLDTARTEGGQAMGRITDCAEDIERAAQSIRKLSDHLRNFARGVKEQHEEVNLQRVLDDALFIADNRIRGSGVALVRKTGEAAFLVTGAANQLEQVFVNLIGNACDAMVGRSRRRLTIDIAEDALDEKPAWTCRVSDSGPGVPADDRERLFKAFYTTKPKGKGTGIGLSISAGIVKEHGGTLACRASPEGGACFAVTLPARSPAAPAS